MKTVPEMIYNVSSGMLNSTLPYTLPVGEGTPPPQTTPQSTPSPSHPPSDDRVDQARTQTSERVAQKSGHGPDLLDNM